MLSFASHSPVYARSIHLNSKSDYTQMLQWILYFFGICFFMIYDNLKEPCPDQKATSIFFPEPVMKLTYLKCD